MARISVVVPVFNVEKYVPRCLESLRRQSLRDIEIIVVNDGSTDTSGQILAMAAAVDERIVVIEQKNSGVSAARNAALARATGDILVFVDGDDVLNPRALSVISDAFELHSPSILTFGAYASPLGETHEWLENALSPEPCVCEGFTKDTLREAVERPYIWLRAFSRVFVEQAGLRFSEDLVIGEDQAFLVEALMSCQKRVAIADRLYTYRVVREGSAMQAVVNDRQRLFSKNMILAEHVLGKARELNMLDAHKSDFLRWVLELLLHDVRRIGKAGTAQRDLQALVSKYFGSVDSTSLDRTTRALLGNMGDGGFPARLARTAVIVAEKFRANPAHTARTLAEHIGNLAPLRAASGASRRVLPAASHTDWKRLRSERQILHNEVQDLGAYLRLVREWESTTQARA